MAEHDPSELQSDSVHQSPNPTPAPAPAPAPTTPPTPASPDAGADRIHQRFQEIQAPAARATTPEERAAIEEATRRLNDEDYAVVVRAADAEDAFDVRLANHDGSPELRALWLEAARACTAQGLRDRTCNLIAAARECGPMRGDHDRPIPHGDEFLRPIMRHLAGMHRRYVRSGYLESYPIELPPSLPSAPITVGVALRWFGAVRTWADGFLELAIRAERARLAELAGGQPPRPETEHTDPDSAPLLDRTDIAILKELFRVRPKLVTLYDLEKCASRKSVGPRVNALIDVGLVCRPRGPRGGVGITEAGVAIVNSIPADPAG